MRFRTLVGALGLAGALVLGVPSAASAEESVGGCIVEEFEKAEQSGLEGEELHKLMEKSAEDCVQAPNPILPAVNEIIWGLASFLILLFVLWKFALPPIRKTMEARVERIRNDLMGAEQARAEAENIQKQYEARLSDANAEAQRILDEARSSAAALKSDLQKRAEADIADLKTRAQADVESAKSQALADLRGDVASIAFGAAEQVVERSLDRDTQIQLIENYINQVETGR